MRSCQLIRQRQVDKTLFTHLLFILSFLSLSGSTTSLQDIKSEPATKDFPSQLSGHTVKQEPLDEDFGSDSGVSSIDPDGGATVKPEAAEFAPPEDNLQSPLHFWHHVLHMRGLGPRCGPHRGGRPFPFRGMCGESQRPTAKSELRKCFEKWTVAPKSDQSCRPRKILVLKEGS